MCFFCFLVALVLGYYWGNETGYRKAYQETIPAIMAQVDSTLKAVPAQPAPSTSRETRAARRQENTHDNIEAALEEVKAAVASAAKPTVSKTETATKPAAAQTQTTAFDANALTMVNFKQAWADSPTIALKNNTDKDITHVKFRVVYYDMKGNQIDYQDVEKKVVIAAGLSKTIEYRMSLSTTDYYYCKTTGYKGMDTTPYNIKFQLLSYR